MIDRVMEPYLIAATFAGGELPKAGEAIGVSTPSGENFDAQVVSVCPLRRTGVVRILAQADDRPLTSRDKSWLWRQGIDHRREPGD